MKQRVQEMVLYYRAEPGEERKDKGDKDKAVRLMKSVLVRMGVRIKNIENDQVLEKVGYLAGIEGYLPRCLGEEESDDVSGEFSEGNEGDAKAEFPVISRDVLVMKNFTSNRIDVLLAGLRKAGVPRIELKAVVTPRNVDWSFYQLYQELVKEHEQLQDKK